MAIMKKYALKTDYVQVPNKTAKAVESDLSLQSLGLIVNLWSYNVEEWELHKTQLYKRFVKNKETSVKNAWNELLNKNYIIEFKYRVGKKWDYVYIYRIKPFSEEEKENILKESKEQYGEISALDFQDLKMKSPKWRPQKPEVSNIIQTKNNINEIKTKEKQSNINQDIPIPYSLADEIFNLQLPMNLRKKLEGNREKVESLNFNIFEFERFYNRFEWIKENSNQHDVEYLSQWDIEAILEEIFKQDIYIQTTTYGLLKQFAYTRLHYKRENYIEM